MLSNERPAYRVLAVAGFYVDDELLALDTEFYYDGIPNDELEPLNEPARQKMIAYLDELDRLGREAAAKAGRAYAGRPRNLDGAIELATAIARNSMPIMAVKIEEPTIEKIEKTETPETGSIRPRGQRGRPRKNIAA